MPVHRRKSLALLALLVAAATSSAIAAPSAEPAVSARAPGLSISRTLDAIFAPAAAAQQQSGAGVAGAGTAEPGGAHNRRATVKLYAQDVLQGPQFDQYNFFTTMPLVCPGPGENRTTAPVVGDCVWQTVILDAPLLEELLENTTDSFTVHLTLGPVSATCTFNDLAARCGEQLAGGLALTAQGLMQITTTTVYTNGGGGNGGDRRNAAGTGRPGRQPRLANSGPSPAAGSPQQRAFQLVKELVRAASVSRRLRAAAPAAGLLAGGAVLPPGAAEEVAWPIETSLVTRYRTLLTGSYSPAGPTGWRSAAMQVTSGLPVPVPDDYVQVNEFILVFDKDK